MAGAGIAGGQVFGSSDRNGAYPASDPIRPQDLTATIFHLLGIDHRGFFRDKLGRPQAVSRGEPLHAVLGTAPATAARCEPGGDPSFVPPYDASLLLDTDFASGRPLLAVEPPSREKGWRGWPLGTEPDGNGNGLVVQAVDATRRHVLLGPGPAATIAAGARAMLAQEIRLARGGEYAFTVRASGSGATREQFERDFRDALVCRLVLFRFAEASKDPRRVQELASLTIRPDHGDFGQAGSFTLRQYLGSTAGGVNFPIGHGLGVAVVVENATGAPIGRVGGVDRWSASLKIHDVALTFRARPRHENTVD
jgi:hypothetical protein